MIKFLIFLCFFSLSLGLLAQENIETENDLGVEELIKNRFIKGSCSNVSNINSIGSESISIGEFRKGEDVINVADGIIITTGGIALAPGPNNTSEAGLLLGNMSEDPDLSLLATDDLFDATGIEFDFVPLDNRITFRYVFASEEYCEYVGSSFNDVFGFFVSGPGINGPFQNGAINVAKLFGTDLDVSINNVNHIINSDFYINNVTNLDAESCMIDYNPTAEDYIEYDGYTIPLIASFEVIPCETYRIRLVIGDVGDDDLDSAVFLESNSFDLGQGIEVRAEVPGSDNVIAYEDCIDGQFVFTRSALSNINEDLIINYSISSDSKAENGIDFLEIPLSITIPAGDTSFVLPITIIDDAIIEGPENLKLELFYDCDCIDPSVSELIITEAIDFSVNLEDILVCTNQPFAITPTIIGGVAPYSFIWDNGNTTDTLISSVIEATQYSVTITDFCGNSSRGTIAVDIQSVPVASLSGTFDFCEVVDTGIPVSLEGNLPWEIGYSIDGVEQDMISNIQSSPYFIPVLSDGIYELTLFNDAFCQGVFEGEATVESNLILEVKVISPSCYNSSDGSIEIKELDAPSPFTINWNVITEDDYVLDNLREGTYILSIVDGDECSYERTFELIADDSEDCSPLYIPNIFSPNGDGINDMFSVFYDPLSGIENIASLQIYSRWGEKIFERNNSILDNNNFGWDGNYNGGVVNSGVYVYFIIVNFEDGSTQKVMGDVTVVR